MDALNGYRYDLDRRQSTLHFCHYFLLETEISEQKPFASSMMRQFPFVVKFASIPAGRGETGGVPYASTETIAFRVPSCVHK